MSKKKKDAQNNKDLTLDFMWEYPWHISIQRYFHKFIKSSIKEVFFQANWYIYLYFPSHSAKITIFKTTKKSDWLKGLVLYNKNRPQRGEIYGALGRNRTGTSLRTTDFKSAASTCSATSASSAKFILIILHNCNI